MGLCVADRVTDGKATVLIKGLEKMRLCFLVGSMAISGGTYVIIQHASWLARNGYDVTLAVQEPFTPETLAWHDEASLLRSVPIDEARCECFDLVIATWWKTALELGAFDAHQYAYFVQSIESRFYPEEEGPLRALVDATYRFPACYVTEATWIREHLSEAFGQSTTLVRNGIRKDVYLPTGQVVESRPDVQPRVLVEGHFGVSFKNTALAIRLARQAGARDIWVLTGSPVSWIPGVRRVFSRVPMQQTASIYRACDILIKLSTVEGMFGPPLEAFHCGGTSIVFDVTGHDEYIVDGVNARVVQRGDMDGVVEALRELLQDRKQLLHLKSGALETAAKWPSWEEASAEFGRWVEHTLVSPISDRAQLQALATLAWQEYGEAERLRLQQSPSIVRRQRRMALMARIPAWLLHHIKRAEVIAEVWLRARSVH